jgi:uncharacterized protein YgiM (DUF1202 family)
MLSASLLAQTATNPPTATPIETPAAAPMATNEAAPLTPTNTPAAKAKKKGGAKKGAGKKKSMAELKTVPLAPGMAEVVASNVNVRGQARLKSEVVTRVTKGAQVMVIEEIVHNNSGPEEPSAWAKILLPPSAHVWANAAFIDSTNQSVKATKLNLRSGPGENYSVLGQLGRGDSVKQIDTKGNWIEIEPPTNAYAFMAAQYLKQETPAVPATAPETVASVAPVNEPPTVATPPTETPVTPAPGEAANATNAAAPAAPTNAPAATEEPPKPRIVEREGIVRGMTSIQAPSGFELISPDNGKAIDYLYSTSPDLDLRRYKGLRIIVSGEEGLDERWRNTPVLTIQKIQVVE